MKPPGLLMYSLRGETAKKVRLVAMRFRIRVRPVAPWEYEDPLGALVDGQKSPPPEAAGQEFEEPMLVMGFFPAGMMDAFVRGLQRAGVPPISLKAVLTPTNLQWNSRKLREELSREREAFQKGAPPAHQM